MGPHPVEPRASTAMLPPVLSKVVDVDPLAWLEFTKDAIMTSCKSGMSITFPLTALLPHPLFILTSAVILAVFVLRLAIPSSRAKTNWEWLADRLFFLFCLCTGHVRTWKRPSDSTAQVGETSAS